MKRLVRILGVGMGAALLALTALGPISYADEERASGQGGWLGVKVQRISDEWREQTGYQGRGVVVTRIIVGGPADVAGIALGDLLVSVGSRVLRDPDDLAAVERMLEPGQPVSVALGRNGGRLLKVLNVDPATPPEEIPVPLMVSEKAPAAEPQVEETTPTPAAPEANTPKKEASAEPSPSPPEAPAVARGSLGVRGEDLTPDLASAFGVAEGHGVLVLKVEKGGPADQAGIRSGDVITRVGDEAIDSVDRLNHVLEASPALVSILTLRKGTERSVAADLRPPVDAARSSGAESGESSLVAHDQGWRDHVLLELRDEVRKLRAEIQKLSTELEAMRMQ